ncbi:MAG: glycosyltransferase family 9 protein, partial [Leptospirales bacterium]
MTTLFSEPLPRTSGAGDSPLPGRSRLPEGSAVLVVLFGRIGDVVFTLPSVAALAKARPDVSIDWIVEDRCADLLRGHPHIREIILFKRSEISGLWRKGHPIRALREMAALVRSLRLRPYAAVLDFQGLLKSGIAAGLARGATKLGSPSAYGRLSEGAGLCSRQVP